MKSAALRKEVALLTDTSPSPHAVQQRMAKMLRQAVDEVVRDAGRGAAEAAALIAEAEAEVDAEQQKHKELLGGPGCAARQPAKLNMTTQRKGRGRVGQDDR